MSDLKALSVSDLKALRRGLLVKGYINKAEAIRATECSRSTIDEAFDEVRKGIEKKGKRCLSRDVRAKDLFDVLGFQEGIEY